VSLASGLFGIYAFFYSPRPRVTFAVVATTLLNEISTRPSGLSVTLNGVDLTSQGFDARILGVQVTNSGDLHLTPAMFDGGVGWGFCLTGGRIQSVRVTNASSQYIADSVKSVTLTDSKCVRLPLFVLDKRQSFVFEAVVVHPFGAEPAIEPFGKVAGGEMLVAALPPPGSEQQGLAARAFSGPLPVQASRLVGYPFAALLLLTAIGLTAAGLGEVASWRMRRRRSAEISSLPAVPTGPGAAIVRDLYVTHGRQALHQLVRTLRNRIKLRRALSSEAPNVHLQRLRSADFTVPPSIYLHAHLPVNNAVSALKEAGLVSVGPSGATADQQFVEAVQALMDALNQRKHLS
jgi:hypothetical protein